MSVEDIKELNNTQLVHLFSKNGFDEWLPTLKRNNVDGQKLMEASEFEVRLWNTYYRGLWKIINQIKANPKLYLSKIRLVPKKPMTINASPNPLKTETFQALENIFANQGNPLRSRREQREEPNSDDGQYLEPIGGQEPRRTQSFRDTPKPPPLPNRRQFENERYEDVEKFQNTLPRNRPQGRLSVDIRNRKLPLTPDELNYVSGPKIASPRPNTDVTYEPIPFSPSLNNTLKVSRKNSRTERPLPPTPQDERYVFMTKYAGVPRSKSAATRGPVTYQSEESDEEPSKLYENGTEINKIRGLVTQSSEYEDEEPSEHYTNRTEIQKFMKSSKPRKPIAANSAKQSNRPLPFLPIYSGKTFETAKPANEDEAEPEQIYENDNPNVEESATWREATDKHHEETDGQELRIDSLASELARQLSLRKNYSQHLIPNHLPRPPVSHPDIQQVEEIYATEYYHSFDYNLNNEPYYRNTDRKGAKQLLQNLEDGAFLFRPSQQQQFFVTLTIKWGPKYFNLGILKSNKKIRCDTNSNGMTPEFNSFAEFIDYFQRQPLVIRHSNEYMIYLKPVLPEDRF